MAIDQNEPAEEFSDYEKVYLQMSRAFKPIGKEHWGIHCVCSIASNSTEHKFTKTDVRAAWKCLAVEFPGLTVRPVEFTKHFETLNENVVEDWAEATFFSSNDSTADEIIQSSGPRDLPSLYFLPKSMELVFLSQHWRTDALGCCMIFDKLIEHLAKKTSPVELLAESRRWPSPCLETAAGASFDVDEETKKYAKDTISSFHAKAVQSGGLPYQGDNKLLPGKTQHRELALSVSQSDSVVEACKKQNISVSAAVHTALARTYFSFAESNEDKQKGYTTVMATNARPHLQPPYNEPAHACQTYVASITPTVPYDSDFVSAARELSNEYKTWCTPQLMKSLCWAYKFHRDALFAAGPPAKPPSGVTLSSLGVVEKFFPGQYGDIEVENFRFGVSMMTRQTLLYAWTFRGQLTLSLDYNEAYYEESMVQEVLERVKKHLGEGLQVLL
ncbi:hypothetical protein M409DRAFT_49156 [Zasmidium cellare ATCC 36951]|uniref:Phthiocerol/phthiodiolone dimycocerosyl transferase C-terminal domain-containing protein n=1 Tax=Zasmidium cellare ATCC 36951 TaxID=1080233 RepID=A0A6A6D2F3_ZASCE|nr:uncharacterized protein M409DRAFT_49156 [Zasmidium cellare ATCC 36951]KAF2172598.1 hypothetical protein M409DRAFT_49156 [Zasmidium cellare ATCC 36951]